MSVCLKLVGKDWGRVGKLGADGGDSKPRHRCGLAFISKSLSTEPRITKHGQIMICEKLEKMENVS